MFFIYKPRIAQITRIDYALDDLENPPAPIILLCSLFSNKSYCSFRNNSYFCSVFRKEHNILFAQSPLELEPRKSERAKNQKRETCVLSTGSPIVSDRLVPNLSGVW